MGRYVRIADLAGAESWDDLARASSRDSAVDGDALQADPPTAAAAAAIARLESEIAAAESVVDGYLPAGYRDPRAMDGPPSIVGVRALDIALERVFGPGAERDGFPRRARAEAALDWLRRVSRGEVVLPDADGDGEPDDIGILIDPGPDPTFTAESLSGFTSSPVS